MDILEVVGNTPLVKIEETIYAKLEYFNPTGSIKDRIVKEIIETIEREDLIREGKIVEATSGNTGIALAWMGAMKGYKVKILMPRYMSEERKKLIRLLGADLELCDTPEECIKRAKEYEKEGYFFVNQFSNPYNVRAHLKTGEEIWEQSRGRVTHFFAGIGTGGTITGVGKYLKAKNPKIKIVGVMPKEGEIIQGLVNIRENQGYASLLDEKVVDEIVEVSRKDALRGQKALIKKGILGGESAGAIYSIMGNYLGEFKVFIVADSVFKYLSTLQ